MVTVRKDQVWEVDMHGITRRFRIVRVMNYGGDAARLVFARWQHTGRQVAGLTVARLLRGTEVHRYRLVTEAPEVEFKKPIKEPPVAAPKPRRLVLPRGVSREDLEDLRELVAGGLALKVAAARCGLLPEMAAKLLEKSDAA